MLLVLVGVDVAVSSIGSGIFSLGFMRSGVLRGLSLGFMAAASRCSSVYPDGSVPLGGVPM